MNNESFEMPVYMDSAEAVALQRSFINRVFGWMTAGLGVTAFTAYMIAAKYSSFIIENRGSFIILAIVEFLLVIGLTSAIHKISPLVAVVGFILFSAINGVTLSWIFMAYSTDSITSTFLTTALTFGAMGLYGWVTKRDLTSIGSFASMALIGLIIASVINIFWRNSGFDMLISAVGILIFIGLTAYDTQKIKALAFATGEGAIAENDSKKFAVIGALTLYLDFINLFLYLLRFLGNRK